MKSERGVFIDLPPHAVIRYHRPWETLVRGKGKQLGQSRQTRKGENPKLDERLTFKPSSTRVSSQWKSQVNSRWKSTHRRKKEAASAGQLLEFIENREGAQRERDAMRLKHFHAAGGDFPDGGFEVELGPFRRAQFTLPGAHQCEQFESVSRLQRPVIVLNGAQQAAERLRSDDSGAGFDGRRDERAAQGDGWVVFGPRRRDGEAEDVAYRGSELAGSFMRAARLNLLKDAQDLPRGDSMNRSRAQRRDCSRRRSCWARRFLRFAAGRERPWLGFEAAAKVAQGCRRY